MTGLLIDDVRALREDRRARERAVTMQELEANATGETLRHKRESVIDSMFDKGKLTQEQRMAAHEICEIWTSITSNLFAKVQQYEQRIQGGAQHDWRAGKITAYHERYIPWRNEAGARIVRPRQSVADIVFLVAVDNYGFEQTGMMLRMDRRNVLNYVRESLMRYAQIAGWVDHCGQSTARK